jgi:hypothetical protein
MIRDARHAVKHGRPGSGENERLAPEKLANHPVDRPAAGPKKEMPMGSLSPVNPAGTIKSGKPVRLAMFVADAVGLAGAVSGGAVSNARLRGDVGYTIASSFSAAKRPSTAARTSGRP